MSKVSITGTRQKGSDRTEDPREKAISDVISRIEGQFGKGAITRLGDTGQKMKLEVIPSGSIGLDWAIGVGGYPRGRIIEIFGPESAGKTSLALHCISEANKLGGVCAFIDAEHALDTDYAARIGVDTESLLVSQPDTGEQALEITETLVRSGAVDVIVVDSVAALVPKAEIDGEMGDSHMGLQARLMSQALRKLAGIVSKTSTVVLFINQLRDKISQSPMYGNPETTTGGRALKFYASLRLDIRKIGSIQSKDGTVIGNRVRVKVVKNKVAPPFKQSEFDILYGVGISPHGEVLDYAEKFKIVEKSGTWYALTDGTRLGQGRETVREVLLRDKELFERMRKAVVDRLQ